MQATFHSSNFHWKKWTSSTVWKFYFQNASLALVVGLNYYSREKVVITARRASTWPSIYSSTVNKMKKRWECDLNLHSRNPTISGNQSKRSSCLTTLIFHWENPLENYGIQLPPSPLEIFIDQTPGEVWIFSGTTQYFHTTENISIVRNWTKLWKLDFPTFSYYISKIFPYTMKEAQCFQCL